MVFNAIVIISPAKGKEARVEEVIGKQVETIKNDEPGLLYDRCYKRTDLEGEIEFVIIQKYVEGPGVMKEGVSSVFFLGIRTKRRITPTSTPNTTNASQASLETKSC